MDAVGGRFVAGKEEDKGVSCDFRVGEGRGVRRRGLFGGRGGGAGFEEETHEVHAFVAVATLGCAGGDIGLFAGEEFVEVLAPLDVGGVRCSRAFEGKDL